MSQEIPFDGFKELIQDPLEKSDPRSFNSIKKIFLDVTSTQPNPFSLLIQRISGKNFSNKDAIGHWRHILDHKKKIESKLDRPMCIQAAAMDYFDQTGTDEIPVTRSISPTKPQSPESLVKNEEWLDRIYAPGYYMERLKEEMLRAKRYKHALSAIMLDVDEFQKINEMFSYQVGDRILILIVKIIKKLIRTVDIIARHSGDRFLIILPNTNKREASELAERLRASVNQRTKRVEGLANGVSLTLSVGQCAQDDSSVEFIKRLESLLAEGKRTKRNAVYSLES